MRFLVVGVLATVVSVGGFNVLVHGTPWDGRALLASEPILGWVVANVAGGLIAYAGARSWVFGHRTNGKATVANTALFFGIGAATMLIPLVFLVFSRYALGLNDQLSDNISANVIGLGVSTAARFWLFRRYVFTHVS